MIKEIMCDYIKDRQPFLIQFSDFIAQILK